MQSKVRPPTATPSRHLSEETPRSPQRREYKLIVVGDCGVGKTSLTFRFVHGTFTGTYDPTIEDVYRKQCTVDGEPALLDVLDTARGARTPREGDVRGAAGCLLVYSITSAASFAHLSETHERIQALRSHSQPGPLPTILVANKSDLAHARQVARSDGEALASVFGCRYVETSAKDGVNVDEAFTGVVRDIIRRMKQAVEPLGSGPGEAGRQAHSDDTGACCRGCVVL